MLFKVLQLGYVSMGTYRTAKGTWQFGIFTVISSIAIVRRDLIFSHTIIMENFNSDG